MKKRTLLSQAHYLTAYIQMSMGIQKQAVVKELIKARLYDPDNKPEEKQRSHPMFLDLLNSAKSIYIADPGSMYEVCHSFFLEKDYCNLEKMLDPVTKIFLDHSKIQQLMSQTKSQCDSLKKSELPIIGFLPVIHTSGNSSVAEKIELDKISQEFLSRIKDLRVTLVEKSTAMDLTDDLNIENLGEFIVKKGMTYVEFGKTPEDVAIQYSVKEALLPSLEKLMKKMLIQLKLDYIFLIKVDRSEFGNMPKMDFAWCIFSKKDPKKPVALDNDTHLPIQKNKSRYKKMSFLFKEYMDRLQNTQ